MLTMAKRQYGNVVNLERFADDGRLTEPADGKKYNWRHMIEAVEKLGRPLNEKETENFRVR